MTDAGMRVSDAERDRAVELLGEHASAGRITDDELVSRSRRANGAVTRGDLRSLFGDLPEPHPLPAPATRPSWNAGSNPAGAAAGADPGPTADPSPTDSPGTDGGTATTGEAASTAPAGPWPTMPGASTGPSGPSGPSGPTSSGPDPTSTGSSSGQWPTLGAPSGAGAAPSTGAWPTLGEGYRPADSGRTDHRQADNLHYGTRSDADNSAMAAYPQQAPSNRKPGQDWTKYLWAIIPIVVVISIASEGRMSFLIPLVIIGGYVWLRHRRKH